MLRFAFTYATLALASSLVSWGRVPGGDATILEPWTLLTTEVAVHMATHALLGALVGIPSRDWRIMALGALAVLAIDFDHVGSFTGLPIASRTGHSLAFMLLASVLVWRLAKAGFFGIYLQPIQLAGITAASIPAHIAVDVMSHGGDMPLLAPISFSVIFIPAWFVWIFYGTALLIVWASSVLSSSQRRTAEEFVVPSKQNSVDPRDLG